MSLAPGKLRTGKDQEFFVDRIPLIRDRLTDHMREVVNGAAITMILKVIGAGLAFWFNVVLARKVGADGAGIYYLALTVATIATIFGRMGLDNALLRFTASHASIGDWKAVKGLYHQGMSMALFASVASWVVVFVAAPWLANSVFSKPELAGPLRWMSLSVVPVTLLFLHAEMLKGLKRVFDFALVQGQNGVAISGLSVLFLYLLGTRLRVNGAAIAYATAAALTALIGYLLWLRATPQLRGISGRFARGDLFRSSRPLFWSASINMAINWMTTFILGIWRTSAEVGIFSIAARTSMLTSFILFAFNSIAAPKFAALHAQGDMRSLGEMARSSAKMMAIAVSPIVLVFILFPQRVMALFGSNFNAGAAVLVILSLGQFVNVATGSVGYLLMMSGNEIAMRNTVTITAILSLILNLLLVPFWGMLGAAIAVALCVSLLNIIAAYYVWVKLGISTIPFLKRAGI